MPQVTQMADEFSEVYCFYAPDDTLEALQKAEAQIKTPLAIAMTGGSEYPQVGHYQVVAAASLEKAGWINAGRRYNPGHPEAPKGPTFWYKVFPKNKVLALKPRVCPYEYYTKEQREYWEKTQGTVTNCGCGLNYGWRDANPGYQAKGYCSIILSRTRLHTKKFPGSTRLGRFGQFTYLVNLPQKRERKRFPISQPVSLPDPRPFSVRNGYAVEYVD